MNRMPKSIALLVLLFAFGWTAVAGALSREVPSHFDGNKNPDDCAGCHKGRGVSGTPLLKAMKDDLCFECHGSQGRKKARFDIQSQFVKRSNHPIFLSGKYHSRGEVLPEQEPSAPRHVSCLDCHTSHLSTSTAPWAGAKGYARGRVRMAKAAFEYELCYLCHADSKNRPPGSKNKAEEFDPVNESFHPIETIGRNHQVPSLVRGLTPNSRITCSDCHSSSDQNGPKGPHGSDYEHILIAEYKTADGIESGKAYELCYMCHDRRSILRDESFKKHNLHVVMQSTSCFTCHNSHGIRNGKHLISFNPAVVSPSNSNIGPAEYLPRPVGRCYLRCHNSDHNKSGVYKSNGYGTPIPW